MRSHCVLVMVALLLLLPGGRAFSMKPLATEMQLAHQWSGRWMSGEAPFSLIYDGQPSSALLKSCKMEHKERKLDDNRMERSFVWTDPKTSLQIRCVLVEYSDYPVLEWTLYFKNTGSADTPILEKIEALDMRLDRGADGEFVLHHQTGSICQQDDFEPHATPLPPKAEKRITTSGGRPSNSDWPYFNIESPGGGLIMVVGWPGQWEAKFTRDEGNGLQIRAGQELTHFKLHPGEEVRSPLIALQFWQGDRLRAHNLFRRWMVAHNLPRPGGKLPSPQLTPCSSHQYHEMVHADEASQIQFIDRYLEEGMKPDYWWMDAGWYPCDDWPKTGTWEVDKARFPKGFRPISDHAHSKGVKIIVWFEPERVRPGTWLYDNHPDWLLSAPDDGGQKLLNLGNPEARKWLTDHIDQLITREGIDLYRQDFNMDPLAYWRASDAEDRQGICEIKHVTGYLAYWDELRKRHPNMLIDSCASGGRRNDLETLRRAVPLLRSDYIFEPIGQQAHTYGLSFWVPYYGTGMNAQDAYAFRSAMCSGMIGCWDMRSKDLDYASLRKLIAEWRQISPNFMGDYYPLSGYSLGNDQWMAWQFDRPEAGEGIVQAFRRAESPYESARFKLHGLDQEARYRFEKLDASGSQVYTGRELMEQGLSIPIAEKPGSAILTYQRVD